MITINEKLRKKIPDFKSPSQSDGLKTPNEVRLPLALLLSTPVCQGWVENSHVSCSEPGALCQVNQEALQLVFDSWDSWRAGDSGSCPPFFLASFWCYQHPDLWGPQSARVKVQSPNDQHACLLSSWGGHTHPFRCSTRNFSQLNSN